jgi:hypothetical protein
MSVILCGTFLFVRGFFPQLGFSRRPQLRGILTRHASCPSCIRGITFFSRDALPEDGENVCHVYSLYTEMENTEGGVGRVAPSFAC